MAILLNLVKKKRVTPRWRVHGASELSELVFSRRQFTRFVEIVNNHMYAVLSSGRVTVHRRLLH